MLRYRELSVRDDFTGLFTRHLYQTLQPELDNHPDQSLSIIFIDFDTLKRVVDTYYHLNTSNTITELTKTVIVLLPEGCYWVRYGGDEFIVVLANHDRQEGFMIAEQPRITIDKPAF